MGTSVNRGGVTRAMLGVAAATAIALAGCGTTPQAPKADSSGGASREAGRPNAEANPEDDRKPVADAGGMCKLLSYQVVADATDVEFDHAASADGACALQVLGHQHPDLTLAASDTEVKPKEFGETFAPDGAAEVGELGQAAYRTVGRPEGKAGPVAEVGWLVDKKVYLLRYTFEKGATSGQAKQMGRKLVGLAKVLKTS
ncbi:MAG: hypothetical protein ACRDTU_20195 [Micromonosporaceae bacterium]